MTDKKQYVIDADTKAEIKVLVQGRIEDRETIKELAGDMKEMANNVSTMAIAITEQTKNNEHLNQRLDKVETVQVDQGKDIKVLSNNQTGNIVRWQVLGASLIGFIAISGIVVSIVLAALDNYSGAP